MQTTAVAALPSAHRRLAKAGAHPTYLIDYPVANDATAAATIADMIADGSGTAGAQLHPWVNPPQDEAMTLVNSFVGNVPIDTERAKLEMLTDRLRLSFGAAPTVYRAGRYGVGPNSAALLEAAGYRLDVSVRPLFDYSSEGGPDFRRHPVTPWWAGPRGTLLELPLGTAFTGLLGPRGQGLYEALPSRLRGGLARAGLVNRVPLTPEGVRPGEAMDAIDRMADRGVTLFSLSFHSPSVVPGHTPYVRDAADLAAFWRWWDQIFDHFARRGIAPASPAQLIAAADLAKAGAMGL